MCETEKNRGARGHVTADAVRVQHFNSVVGPAIRVKRAQHGVCGSSITNHAHAESACSIDTVGKEWAKKVQHLNIAIDQNVRLAGPAAVADIESRIRSIN